jgi:hypothetical protein
LNLSVCPRLPGQWWQMGNITSDRWRRYYCVARGLGQSENKGGAAATGSFKLLSWKPYYANVWHLLGNVPSTRKAIALIVEVAYESGAHMILAVLTVIRHLPIRHLPRDICLETFAQNDICPEDICPDDICLERHLPRWTFTQMDICPENICPKRHLSRKTFAQKMKTS